jgi:chemotaxis protein MotB
MSRGWKLIVVVSLVLSGCVSAGKYNELERQEQGLRDEYEKTKTELALAEARISELSGKLGIADTQKTKLETSVAEMKTALEEMQKRRQESEKRLAEFRELTAKFSKLVNAGKLNVKVINGRMTIALSTDILFPSGSAKLSPEGLVAIKEVTQLLSSLEGRKYQIEGHTDNVPIKTSSYPSNWELASARAMTVLKTMEEAGMPQDRISAASYGDTQPIAKNSSKDGKAQNRRIAIAIVPDLSGLPGNEELHRVVSSAEKN